MNETKEGLQETVRKTPEEILQEVQASLMALADTLPSAEKEAVIRDIDLMTSGFRSRLEMARIHEKVKTCEKSRENIARHLLRPVMELPLAKYCTAKNKTTIINRMDRFGIRFVGQVIQLQDDGKGRHELFTKKNIEPLRHTLEDLGLRLGITLTEEEKKIIGDYLEAEAATTPREKLKAEIETLDLGDGRVREEIMGKLKYKKVYLVGDLVRWDKARVRALFGWMGAEYRVKVICEALMRIGLRLNMRLTSAQLNSLSEKRKRLADEGKK